MLTLGQAAKETGVSKTAISRAIKAGRLSATRNDLGEYQIDPAELFRVYPPASQRNTEAEQPATPQDDPGLPALLAMMREERDRERQQLQATIDDLRRRLDAETEERREAQAKLTALLTYQPPAPEPPPPAPPMLPAPAPEATTPPELPAPATRHSNNAPFLSWSVNPALWPALAIAAGCAAVWMLWERKG